MLYLSFASYQEAKPFINLLKLKKNMSVFRFELFHSAEAALIITGEGSMEAASAVSFMLAKMPDDNNFFCHIRISDSDGLQKSALCNQILSPDGRVFYPDILFSHPFEECAENSPEAAGAFRAASMFLPLHRIFVFNEKIKPGFTDGASDEILEWLKHLSKDAESKTAFFEAVETDLLNHIRCHLHLTQTLSLELERLARFQKLRGDNLEDLLADCMVLPCGSTQEGKKVFAELRKKLLDF